MTVGDQAPRLRAALARASRRLVLGRVATGAALGALAVGSVVAVAGALQPGPALAAVGAGALAGAVLGWLRRPRRSAMAAYLDRSWESDALIVSAAAVLDGRVPTSSLAPLVVRDAEVVAASRQAPALVSRSVLAGAAGLAVAVAGALAWSGRSGDSPPAVDPSALADRGEDEAGVAPATAPRPGVAASPEATHTHRDDVGDTPALPGAEAIDGRAPGPMAARRSGVGAGVGALPSAHGAAAIGAGEGVAAAAAEPVEPAAPLPAADRLEHVLAPAGGRAPMPRALLPRYHRLVADVAGGEGAGDRR